MQEQKSRKWIGWSLLVIAEAAVVGLIAKYQGMAMGNMLSENARYLSDVIRNISEDELCMRFNSNVSPCVICPPEGDQYVYLVLPVRVFN